MVKKLIIVICLILFFSSLSLFKYGVKQVDKRIFGYKITDWYASLNNMEDWSSAPKLPVNLDYRWARADKPGPVQIAHALGAWNDKYKANTLYALHQSLAKGMNLMEVDLTLAGDGKLYCFHGPGEPPFAIMHARDRCDFNALVNEMRRSDFYLILDLKSNFEQSSRVVSEALKKTNFAPRVVFQIYAPSDLIIFNAIAKDQAFAGPILTLYRSHRTVFHMAPNIKRMGFHVLTVPVDRISEFFEMTRWRELRLLTHPISSCSELNYMLNLGVAGGYIDSDFACNSN